MPDTYSLTVINNSEIDRPTFAVFATLPMSSSYKSFNLAWLTQPINAGNHYTFTWNLTWGFCWSAQGTQAGYQWAGGGSLPADPNSVTECSAEFTYNGDFQLMPTSGKPNGSTLWIKDSASLPNDQASSVGVTLSGKSACVTDAGRNLHQTYTLHPTYYIDAGQYVEGQMVDGSSVTDFQQLAYTNGNTALTATLNLDNTWNVSNSAQVNFAKMFDTRRRVGV